MTYRAVKAFTVGMARGGSSYAIGDEVCWPIGQLEKWEAMGLVAREGKAGKPAAPAPEPTETAETEAPAERPAPKTKRRARK